MRIPRSLFLRLRNLFHREYLDRELNDELTSHLEMHIADELRFGGTPEAARQDAFLRLGGPSERQLSTTDRNGSKQRREIFPLALRQEKKYRPL